MQPHNLLDFPEKRSSLLMASDKYRQSMEEDITDLKQRLTTISKYALMVGGGMVLTYYLVGFFFASEKKKVKLIKKKGVEDETGYVTLVDDTPNFPPVFQMIMSHIAAFLLAIAKEKLLEFLEEYNKDGQPAASATKA